MRRDAHEQVRYNLRQVGSQYGRFLFGIHGGKLSDLDIPENQYQKIIKKLVQFLLFRFRINQKIMCAAKKRI
jgi:hypothetical protein